MGMRYYVYIGPMMIVDFKEIDGFVTEYGCKNECSQYASRTEKFCSNCGEPNKVIERKIRAKMDLFYDVFQQKHESLFSVTADDGTTVVLPNLHFTDRETEGTEMLSPVQLDDPELISNEMSAFREKFKDAIKQVEQASISSKIVFGSVRYWM